LNNQFFLTILEILVYTFVKQSLLLHVLTSGLYVTYTILLSNQIILYTFYP